MPSFGVDWNACQFWLDFVYSSCARSSTLLASAVLPASVSERKRSSDTRARSRYDDVSSSVWIAGRSTCAISSSERLA
ncbi:hypothetical protein BamMEX5DRAFT_6796 [Burkholderia ambifaria MEX-5]|uniref:Uncharacterized protein n=1 Tax=Burkholderia ambifaria MEX-5 TaxID=396597 RepID=B1TG80_9BURK|nr:hypothetical protein BamMEX5DRAFT_6796 [Burkholderia ambifaria MEX-5]